jgi:fimbrial chaperone protein
VTNLLKVTALALGLLLQAESLSASAFRVTPVRVEFSQGNASTLLTVLNESTEELRFQISAFTWTQDRQGAMKLDETKDITFFPALLTLKPNEERKVRVGTKSFATDTEKTYRIFFEELPPLVNKAESSGASVRILTKMGIPIFVAPSKAKPDAAIDAAAVNGGKLTFDVANRGNVHFSVQGVKVVGLGADGGRLFERQLEGWYVLPGIPRTYEVEVPRDVCSKLKRVEVEATTDVTDPKFAAVSSRVDVAQPSCRSGS